MAKLARVGIVGGGLAGLAAAVALVDRNVAVELFEASDRLGGRSSQLADSDIQEPAECCQQVGAGCDVNLARFLVQVGASREWEVHSRLHFYFQEGKRSDLYAIPGLPAPLHLAPSFFRLGFLSFRERWSIAKSLLELAKPMSEEDADLSVLRWLRLHDQTPNAIERFWSPVLGSSLATGLEFASLEAARKILLDRFLTHRAGYTTRMPTTSMRRALAEPAERWLLKKDAKLHLGSPVRLVLGSADCCQGLLLASGATFPFDIVIVAVPWWSLNRLLSENLRKAIPETVKLSSCKPTAVAFADIWFDRPLTPLSHVTFVDGMSMIRCVFRRHPRAAADLQNSDGFHYQAHLNSSRMPPAMNDEEVALEVRRELIKIWPSSRDAAVIRSRVVAHPQAQFPSTSEFETCRLRQVTSVPNLMLAGDWTQTDKPSSLESAVRSGYLAAEGVLKYLGRPENLLAPELAPEWLARRMFSL